MSLKPPPASFDNLEVFEGVSWDGLSALLVDFYGAGGSGGSGTSIGHCEALDVTQAFAYDPRSGRRS